MKLNWVAITPYSSIFRCDDMAIGRYVGEHVCTDCLMSDMKWTVGSWYRSEDGGANGATLDYYFKRYQLQGASQGEVLMIRKCEDSQ